MASPAAAPGAPAQPPRTTSLPTTPGAAPPPISPRPGAAASPVSRPQGPSAQLSNHYVRRLTSSPKACFVCSRPSPVVLVSHTAGAEDFFYVCSSHLSDRNFARRMQSEAAAPAQGRQKEADRLPDKVGKEEIEKIKREWEERQKAKKDKGADDKAKSDKPGETDKKEPAQGWLSYITSTLSDSTKQSSPQPSTTTATPSPPPPQQPAGHERYQLHRSFYNMRIAAYNKKIALKRAKELDFPSVPRG